MDAIKKKLMSLSSETKQAEERARVYEAEAHKASNVAEKLEEQLRSLQKKFQSIEGQFDVCSEDLFNATMKLENKEKLLNNLEGDVGGLARRILLLEDEEERSEERLGQAIKDLCYQSRRADETVKKRILGEQAQSGMEEQIDGVESQLKEAKFLLADSERKYEDIARKLGTMEAELERANDRAETSETKLLDVEEELKLVGNNLQSLEVSAEKAIQREESYQKKIHDLVVKLKGSETRAENAEMNIQRLNIRIDQIEDDLLTEKLKIKHVSDDLDGTFKQMEYM